MNKDELRKMTKRAYSDLTPEYMQSADAEIRRIVLDMPEYRSADTVFCFVGVKGHEIDTEPLIDRMLEDGKRVCVPLCRASGVMTAQVISSREDLNEGKYHILEPSPDSEQVEKDEIDFAIIPCMTCDKAGKRLGHGGGYYDRYFEGDPVPSAMLCRHEIMVSAIPTEAFDIVFPTVVTERGIIRNA